MIESARDMARYSPRRRFPLSRQLGSGGVAATMSRSNRRGGAFSQQQFWPQRVSPHEGLLIRSMLHNLPDKLYRPLKPLQQQNQIRRRDLLEVQIFD